MEGKRVVCTERGNDKFYASLTDVRGESVTLWCTRCNGKYVYGGG